MSGVLVPSIQGQKLNKKSLKEIIDYFCKLEIPDPSDWTGRFEGEVVGPLLTRKSEWVGNFITGVTGWIGKEFYENKTGMNLVRRKEKIHKVAPATIGTVTSMADGKTVPAIIYPDGPYPVNKVTDEFRPLDDNCLLFLINYNIPFFRKSLFAFLLHRDGTVKKYGLDYPLAK